MKFVLRYMAEYKKESVMAPIFKMLEAIFELLVPFVVAAIIDKGIGGADKSYTVKMVLLMIGLAVIGAVFSLTAQYFAAKTAAGTAYLIRRDLEHTILDMSKADYKRIGKATLLTRMTSDVNQLQNAVNMFLRLFLRSPFIVIGAFVMSMIIDVKMSLIIGGIIAVLAVCIYAVMRITLPRVNAIQKKLDSLIARIKNDYGGAEVIRGFVIQDEEDAKFNSELKELLLRQLNVGRLSNILNPLTFVLVNLGIILVLYFGGGRVDIGELTTGEVVALLNYMSQILVELVKIANLIVLLMKGIPSARRLSEVIDMSYKGGVRDVAVSDKKDEEAEGMSPVVTSIRQVVCNNLKDITAGEKIGVIGPTGSGKSLLLSVYMDDVEDKSKVGYVPQEDTFFEGSIAENILLGEYEKCDSDDIFDDMNKALDMSSFKEVVDVKGGITTQLIKNADNLSVGQKKRLALARALYKKPNMLLMDDVTNPLDMITEKRVIDNMLKSDMAVIIASQKVSAVMRADRILVIDNGRLIDTGSHKELLDRCELYSRMYEAQYVKTASQ